MVSAGGHQTDDAKHTYAGISGGVGLDVVTEIAQTLKSKHEALPAEAAAWLQAHPREASRLLRDAQSLDLGQFIEYQFRVMADAWSADAVIAQESVRDELQLSVGNFRVRWTGRWRVAKMSDDHLAFILKVEQED